MIELHAEAKLTLSLRIVGVRPDGYHLLDAEMVSLDFRDTLELDPEGHGVRIAGPSGEDPVDAPEDDLVRRALRVAGRTAGVLVRKRIPPGAGLGGGSSDAAAVLRWAGVTDPAIAVRLGADVPFCLAGGRARVRGIGEDLEPLEPERRVLTLLTPPVFCSTPEVYRAWDEMGGPAGDNGNDLEPAALAVAPELARWRDALGDACGVRPRLAGSGSTWWVEGAVPGAGRVVTRTTRGS